MGEVVPFEVSVSGTIDRDALEDLYRVPSAIAECLGSACLDLTVGVSLTTGGEATEPVDITGSQTVDSLFDGSPAEVAERLVGRELVFGKKRATITAARGQSAEENSQFIGKEPLFTDAPVDVYVAAVRGRHMLFLRSSEPNSCIRISGIQIGRTHHRTPTQVCNALGINKKCTGRYTVDGDSIIIELETA